MEYLIRFAQAHETFRRPEIQALATLAGINVEFLFYDQYVCSLFASLAFFIEKWKFLIFIFNLLYLGFVLSYRFFSLMIPLSTSTFHLSCPSHLNPTG